MPNNALLLIASAFVVLAPAVRAADLPDGDGKKALQGACIQCHELERISGAGYTLEGWRNNLHMMVNAGSPLPKDQIEMVAQYLTKNFPEKPKPDAVVVPGPVKISIREWTVPTPGSRPHDPALAPSLRHDLCALGRVPEKAREFAQRLLAVHDDRVVRLRAAEPGVESRRTDVAKTAGLAQHLDAVDPVLDVERIGFRRPSAGPPAFESGERAIRRMTPGEPGGQGRRDTRRRVQHGLRERQCGARIPEVVLHRHQKPGAVIRAQA